MRGLVGAAAVFSVMGWFTLEASEMVGRMQDRVQVLDAAASVREASLDLERPPLVEKGKARADWKALLRPGDDLPSGIKQQALWKEQTRRLLAGEPPTDREARRLAKEGEPLARR